MTVAKGCRSVPQWDVTVLKLVVSERVVCVLHGLSVEEGGYRGP